MSEYRPLRDWKAWVLAALIFAFSGCAFQAAIGTPPYSAGVLAKCRGLDGCEVGAEVAGWRVGVAVFPDVGPVEEKDAGKADR